MVRRKKVKIDLEEAKEDPYKVLFAILRKQKYHIVGHHSAVKKCHWLHAALTEGRFCYKCKFYGIETHRCLQMSPAILWCWNACIHCWRLRPQDIGINWDETKLPVVDDPKFIVEKAIEEQRRILSGYKGNHKVNRKLLEEAMNPKHAAISLVGEPLLYPRLSELIQEFHKRGLTTFVVTRAVRPDVIATLEEEPSQLYVSFEAYNKEMYQKLNMPLVPRAWELTMKTLELIPTLSCPVVMRITVMKGINMGPEDAKGFAKLVEIAQPTYIEIKAYMHVGTSTKRLPREAMPQHKDVREFAKMVSEETGYPVVSESIPSRVVLLSRLSKPIRLGNGCPGGWRTPDIGGEESGEYGKYISEV